MSAPKSTYTSNFSVAGGSSPPPGAVPVSWEVGMSERADGGPYEVRLTFADKQAVREWAVWLASLPVLPAEGEAG